MKRLVIARRNIPGRPPLLVTAISIMMLDFYEAAGWVRGAVICILVLGWIGYLVAWKDEVEVDLFEKK